MQHGHLVTERDELEFQLRAAADPASQPTEHRRDECEHAGDITGRQAKSLAFSQLSEFLAGTGIFEQRTVSPVDHGKAHVRRTGG